MAGYKRERRVYVMEFAEPEFEGLEIKVRSIPIRDLMDLMKLDPESEDSTVRADSISKLMSAFAEALVSWNMTDENSDPLPPTLEYIESEDSDFILMCIAQWMRVATQVSDASPLDSTLQPGQPTPEEAPSPQS